ncbi:unnamed protein product [Urochloa humidicola]
MKREDKIPIQQTSFPARFFIRLGIPYSPLGVFAEQVHLTISLLPRRFLLAPMNHRPHHILHSPYLPRCPVATLAASSRATIAVRTCCLPPFWTRAELAADGARPLQLVLARLAPPAPDPPLAQPPPPPSHRPRRLQSHHGHGSTLLFAVARREPPPVAHPPILGEEWVPLTSRMLFGLFSLVGTSPPARNRTVKPAAGRF